MEQLIHILRYKALAGLKLKLDFTWNSLVKNIASVLVFGGFSVAAYYFAAATTAYLLEDAAIGSFLLHRFLSMFLFVFFITISLGNILVSYATLFRSPEVRFLFSLPVAHYKIFLIKFLDNFFYSSTTFFLLGFAVLAGYGSYFGYPWYFYPLMMLFLFIPFMLIAACLAVILLLGVMRLIAYVRISYLITGFIAGYLAVIYFFFRSISPVSLVNSVLEHYPNIDQYFSGFDPWFLKFLPSHWVAEILYWLSRGDGQQVLLYSGLLIISVGSIFAVAVLTGRRHYYRSWLSSGDGGMRTKTDGTAIAVNRFGSGSSPIFNVQTGVLLRRDLLRFVREPSQWIHLSIMLFLVVVFIASVGGMRVEFRDPFLMLLVFLVIYLFNSFLISALSLRFVYPMISLEGEAVWAIRSSPVSPRKLFAVKAVISVCVLLLIALPLTIITTASLYGDGGLVLFSVAGLSFMVLTLAGMNLGLGGYFAQLKEKNPIRIASSQGASLTFLLTMIYLILIVAVFTPFLSEYFEGVLANGKASNMLLLYPIGLVGLISAGILTVTLTLGYKSMYRDI